MCLTANDFITTKSDSASDISMSQQNSNTEQRENTSIVLYENPGSDLMHL